MSDKTYRELILDLENATKRLANTNGWPSDLLNRQLARLESIRGTLKEYLDQVPDPEDKTSLDIERMTRRVESN